MRFHFCLFNHPNSFDVLGDMRVWFSAGLRSVGHMVTESVDQLDTSAVNILWEKFTPGIGRELRRLGVRYGIVATEIPVGDTFNGRSDGPWMDRWAGFVEAAEGAGFIWSMVESTVPDYARWAPSAFVELGYVDELVDRSPWLPTHDFCFLGSPRPYREKIIGDIARHATVYWPKVGLPWEQTGQAMRLGRMGLALKIDEAWPIPSSTRLARLVHARVGIVMDHVAMRTRQSAPVPQCPEHADFTSYALERLARFRADEADEILEHYRREIPMPRVMERVLDLTMPG